MQAYTPPVDQPPPLADDSKFGGFWIRFAAHVVDGFVIGLITLLIVVAIAVAANLGPSAADLLGLAIIAVGQVYHAYFVSSRRMATPGKRLCGVYVTDLEGRRLTFWRALWRNLASFFSYVTLYLGFVMAGVTERKQALHDKLAGTLVHRQPGSSAIGVIVVVVALCVMVPVIGIVAAVAIPAYQDFTYRGKMALVHGAMAGLKEPIAVYRKEKGAWPTTWEQLGVPNPAGEMSANARSVLTDMRLGKEGQVIADLRIMSSDGELRLTPKLSGDVVEWDCSSSEKVRKYVLASCRK